MSNVVPIRDERPLQGFWLSTQIFTGPDGEGMFVPKKDDMVLNKELGWFIVTGFVDSSNGVANSVATLEPWLPVQAEVISENLKKYGIVSTTDDDNRLYIDTTKTPYEINVDPSVCWGGSELSYVKVFLGTDIEGGNSKIISMHLDSSGSLLSENIPLETVAITDIKQHTFKKMMTGHSNTLLVTGEIVTVVVYNKLHKPVKIKQLCVRETGYIKHGNVGQRKVASIELQSQYLDSANNSLLRVPLRLSLRDVPMLAVVRYDNGDARELSVNTGQVSLDGIEAVQLSYAGQRTTLNLTYSLGPDEVATNVFGDEGNYFVQKTYELEGIPNDGEYNVKLFVVPTWDKTYNKWRLEYYLYTLDRNQRYHVTPYVSLSSGSDSFDGTNYRETQWLTLIINLEDINDSALKPFTYTQKVGVTLLRNGLSNQTSWTINYNESNSNVFGANLEAYVNYVSHREWELDISNSFTNNTDFLEALYYACEPMYDIRNESIAPIPTDIAITLGGQRKVIPFTQWDEKQMFTVSGNEGEAATLEWIRNIGDQDLLLGITPLKIRHNIVDNPDLPVQGNVISLKNEFLSIGLDSLRVTDFDGVTSVIEFSPSGTYGLMWNGYISDWINGTGFTAGDYEMSISIVDRWETTDGANTIELTGMQQDTWYDMSNSNRIVLANTTVSAVGASIELEIKIRRKDDDTNVVIDRMIVYKGSI